MAIRRLEHRMMRLDQAMRAHALALEAAGRSASLMSNYALVHRRYLAYLKGQGVKSPTISDINTDRVRGFILYLRSTPRRHPRTGIVRDLGPATIWGHTQAMKALGHFLVAERIIKFDPLAALKMPSTPKLVMTPFTVDEIRRLLDRAGSRALAVRNRAILFFLLATGVRAAELVHMKTTDVDLKGGLAKVFGKGSKERVLLFDRTTAKMLALYLAERYPTGPYEELFLSRLGRPLTKGALLYMCSALGDDAGVADVHPHRFRHSFAHYFLVAHPGALFNLQAALGHSDLGMVRRYSQTVDARTGITGPGVIDTLGLDRTAIR